MPEPWSSSPSWTLLGWVSPPACSPATLDLKQCFSECESRPTEGHKRAQRGHQVAGSSRQRPCSSARSRPDPWAECGKTTMQPMTPTFRQGTGNFYQSPAPGQTLLPGAEHSCAADRHPSALQKRADTNSEGCSKSD